MTDDYRSRGGKSRAERLTKQQRSEIAKKGARARWEKFRRQEDETPYAVANGERQIESIAFPVYNLNDGRRVLSERGFLQIIGARGRGASGGHRLRAILADSVIKHFFSKKVLVAIESPIEFLNESKTLTRGYDAEILRDFCVGFVSAREAGALKTDVQQRYALEHGGYRQTDRLCPA